MNCTKKSATIPTTDATNRILGVEKNNPLIDQIGAGSCMENDRITWVECPRDAMQGVVRFYPTEAKVRYLKQLMHCGFDVIDIGSFVSPKVIPQMADSAEVIRQLSPHKKGNKFLVICANKRGVDEAIDHPGVDIIGFPFSLSETFQQRNTKRSREEAIDELKGHAERIKVAGKSLVVYISMAFGNPYGEVWLADELAEWAKAIQKKKEEFGIVEDNLDQLQVNVS